MSIDDISMVRFENKFGPVWLNPIYIASISSEPIDIKNTNGWGPEQRTIVQLSGCRYFVVVNGSVDEVAQQLGDKLRILKEASR